MSVVFTFPGQGAQREGMLRALPDDRPVRATLDEASDTLGRDASALDSEAALRSTVAVQLALLIAGVAMARSLAAEGRAPDAVAGLSIGAFPAAVTAGTLGFDDALRLVERRAELMEAAFPSGYGMTAILGLEAAALAPLIARVHTAVTPVYLANFNAPTQLVISGSHEAMSQVAALARARGAHGVQPIAIAVPSHCPLLDEAADALAQAVGGTTLRPPQLRYLSASAARELREPARIADDLARNMARPVHWHDTSALAVALGAGLAVEMPPGGVLSSLGRAAFADAEFAAAGETRRDTLLALIEREQRRTA